MRIKQDKYVSGNWPSSTHADPTSTRRAIFDERHISSVTVTSAHLHDYVYVRVGVARALVDSSDFGLLGEQSSQNWRLPALDAVNRRAKFDAASFILGGEIRNRTNKHKTDKQ